MKIGTCRMDHKDVPVVILRSGSVVPVREIGYKFYSVNELIRSCTQKDLREMEKKAETFQNPIPKENVVLTAPIPYPVRDVVCMGLNYKAHADEMADALKEKRSERIWPIFFGKPVDRCVGPEEHILSHSDFIHSLDYECELAAIISKDAYHVKMEEVSEYIFGYTILNDVTARELSRHKQNYFMKGLDRTCPMGPWIVTSDEISYPPKLTIKLSVNGEQRQYGNTGDMIFDLTDIITELTKGMTLQAGTIIATGSPTGIGFGMNPPVYLKDGDIVRCEIEKIGVLKNKVASS